MTNERDSLPKIYDVKVRPASGRGVVETLTLKDWLDRKGNLRTSILHYSHGSDLSERE